MFAEEREDTRRVWATIHNVADSEDLILIRQASSTQQF
jgi:hypothetical protein